MQLTLELIIVAIPLYKVNSATSPPVALSAHQIYGSKKVTTNADALVRAEQNELVASKKGKIIIFYIILSKTLGNQIDKRFKEYNQCSTHDRLSSHNK